MLRRSFNLIISKIKGEEFVLDKRVPLLYLFFFFINKFVSLCYGFFVFPRKTRAFIAPSSIIKCVAKISFGQNLSIARGCYIDALSSDGIVLGKNVSIGKNTTIECTGSLKFLGKGLFVGDNTGLGSNGYFGCAGGVTIGHDTILGNFVSFHSENHNFSDINELIRLQGVNHLGIVVGSNCWLGAKVTILDGSEIGDGCVVAAGAVVRGHFPSNCVIGGIPAKIIKYRVDNNE